MSKLAYDILQLGSYRLLVSLGFLGSPNYQREYNFSTQGTYDEEITNQQQRSGY